MLQREDRKHITFLDIYDSEESYENKEKLQNDD